MADYGDKSAAAGDMLLYVALNNARASSGAGVEILYCQDCGEKIPKARREAVMGCRLCVQCQALEEKCGGRKAV